jgi:hypothetical protein
LGTWLQDRSGKIKITVQVRQDARTSEVWFQATGTAEDVISALEEVPNLLKNKRHDDREED